MGMMGGHEDTGYTSKRLQTYVDHYPFLGVLPEEAGETADINALYAARFGVPPAGKRVFIRTVQQINGWQDRPQTFSARVSPA